MDSLCSPEVNQVEMNAGNVASLGDEISHILITFTFAGL
jgi:hypothetical protein